MSEPDNFYVVLPSNASTDLFPDNSQSRFRVRLRHPLQLHGSWEVGVAEIHMPLYWFNIDEDNDHLELTWANAPQKRVPPNYADNRQQQQQLLKEEDSVEKNETNKVRKRPRIDDDDDEDAGKTPTLTPTQTSPPPASSTNVIAKKKTKTQPEDKKTDSVSASTTSDQVVGGEKETKEEKPQQDAEYDIIVPAGQYENLHHMLKVLRQELGAKGLDKYIRLAYSVLPTPRIVVNIGNFVRITLSEENREFWQKVAGIPSEKIGVPMGREQKDIYLRPIHDGPYNLTEPIGLALFDMAVGAENAEITYIAIPAGNYDSIEAMITTMNSVVPDKFKQLGVSFTYSREEGLLKIELTDDPTRIKIAIPQSEGAKPAVVHFWEKVMGVPRREMGQWQSTRREDIALYPQPVEPITVKSDLLMKVHVGMLASKMTPPAEIFKEGVQVDAAVAAQRTHYGVSKFTIQKSTYPNGPVDFFGKLNNNLIHNFMDGHCNIIYDDEEQRLDLLLKPGTKFRFPEQNWNSLLGLPKSIINKFIDSETQLPTAVGQTATIADGRKKVSLNMLLPYVRPFQIPAGAKVFMASYAADNEPVRKRTISNAKGIEIIQLEYSDGIRGLLKVIEDGIPKQFKDKILIKYRYDRKLEFNIAKDYAVLFEAPPTDKHFWWRTVGLPKSYLGKPITDIREIIVLKNRPPMPLYQTTDMKFELLPPIEKTEEKQKSSSSSKQDDRATATTAAIAADESMQSDQPPPMADAAASHSIVIEQGYYGSLQDLTDTINRVIKSDDRLNLQENAGEKVQLQPRRDKRIQLTLNMKDVGVRFSGDDKSLGAMLGFSKEQRNQWIRPHTKTIGQYPADIRRGVYSIYLYTNIVTPQYLGDSSAPLIRVINPSFQNQQSLYKGVTAGDDIISFHYKTIYYYPLARNYFETIDIELRSDFGQLLKFNGGKTLVQLHFRRRQAA